MVLQVACQQPERIRSLESASNNRILDEQERNMKRWVWPQYLVEPQHIEGCFEENRPQNERDQRLQAETFPIKEDY